MKVSIFARLDSYAGATVNCFPRSAFFSLLTVRALKQTVRDVCWECGRNAMCRQ